MKKRTKKYLKRIYEGSKPIGRTANKFIKERVRAISKQQREYMKTGYDPYSTRF